MDNNIKRCIKEAKENWIGEQCSETEENLRKNDSKRAYQLVKDLTTAMATTREGYYYLRAFKKMPHRRTRDTEPMDRILLLAIQSHSQWRSISTELSPNRHRG